MWKETILVVLVLILYSALDKTLKNISLRRKFYAEKLDLCGKTLRSNCDIGCKTVWSEVLLCIKEDPHGSFYKEFHGSDII